ncbi:putative receptor protein kinase ZmPK1 [Ricinus communis]|uniref:S-locus-specific glycoprotein S13, putative n=1 Tax=Ricinus communis TaxID=3988 RepID=B9R757_RICCO|nr:putative receptor protein kinase ZmPK1 [Ricinus communis]EEF52337.1 S-locus-specific glycoprotein S13 precursor, putative [Ricinus communis]|eukprot:XP_025013388.1 putative receptor protein kinase ZmPK1 [Ricinus communis]
MISPTGVFSAGFYPVGDSAYFSKPSCTANKCTVVWMANRDFPVNGKRSELLLLATGNVIITDAGQSTAWSTDTFSLFSTELRLYDSGNLVLRNMEGVVLWQSFESPTDTLLPWQPLTRNIQLVSSRSPTNFSTGFYKLLFDDYNLLCLVYDDPVVSSVYWPYAWLRSWEGGRFPYSSSRIAILDSLGRFTSSDNFSFISADFGVRLQRRLTLDSDGNARLYIREDDSATWVVSWQARSKLCEIHGICGQNSTCSYNPFSGSKCSCLPGYKIKNATDWSYGCEPEFNLPCDNDTEVGFIKLENIEFYGNDNGFFPNISLKMCEKLCLQSCNCKGYQYRYIENSVVPSCYPKMLLASGTASWIAGIIDPMSDSEYEKSKMELLLTVALECVEDDKDARPTMRRVVELLLQLENHN